VHHRLVDVPGAAGTVRIHLAEAGADLHHAAGRDAAKQPELASSHVDIVL